MIIIQIIGSFRLALGFVFVFWVAVGCNVNRESDADRMLRLAKSPSVNERLVTWVDSHLTNQIDRGGYELAPGMDPGNWTVVDSGFDWSGIDMSAEHRLIRLETPRFKYDTLLIEDIVFVSFTDRPRLSIVVVPDWNQDFDPHSHSLIYFEDRVGVYCSHSACRDLIGTEIVKTTDSP